MLWNILLLWHLLLVYAVIMLQPFLRIPVWFQRKHFVDLCSMSILFLLDSLYPTIYLSGCSPSFWMHCSPNYQLSQPLFTSMVLKNLTGNALLVGGGGIQILQRWNLFSFLPDGVWLSEAESVMFSCTMFHPHHSFRLFFSLAVSKPACSKILCTSGNPGSRPTPLLLTSLPIWTFFILHTRYFSHNFTLLEIYFKVSFTARPSLVIFFKKIIKR